jgi:hypothetical protein
MLRLVSVCLVGLRKRLPALAAVCLSHLDVGPASEATPALPRAGLHLGPQPRCALGGDRIPLLRKDNRPILNGSVYITRVDDGGGPPGSQNKNREIGSNLPWFSFSRMDDEVSTTHSI